MNKKICDLCCVAVARVLCESDDASLCWGCDAAVHGANFLVARHVRVLMCRVCLGRTAWLASGARVGPAASLCCRCSDRKERSGIVERGEGEGEGEVENQVVPLKLAPPLSDDSSSSSSTLPADDLSCASTQSSDSRSTGAESGVAEHEATSSSSSSESKPKQSKRRKRSFAATDLVHATSSSKFKL
ncbi:zinc finger protein CONSTANS-LIKE 1-like protein [Carex littledalei]|uniref:Zinc finger protein CONSTANS-LIKE 1-like protein n=1 Tax=Carex littledalei TaxID=544730 RepID=A0A833QV85_9POAL|nr:zinc finger protein CONSTANS-LIKE 1-like protein [Carex littledalei]